MRLVPEWGRVLRHAWSVRFIALAALLSGAEAALPLLPAGIIAPGRLAELTFFVVMAALVARFVAQQKVSGDRK